MYSLPFSESFGIIVGAAVGRAGAVVGKDLAREYGLPLALGAGLGTFVLHYLAGTVSRTFINVGALDAPGAVLSVVATTPLTAATHGVVEGLIEIFATP